MPKRSLKLKAIAIATTIVGISALIALRLTGSPSILDRARLIPDFELQGMASIGSVAQHTDNQVLISVNGLPNSPGSKPYVLNLLNGKTSPITAPPGFQSFSPDGKWMYCVRRAKGNVVRAVVTADARRTIVRNAPENGGSLPIWDSTSTKWLEVDGEFAYIYDLNSPRVIRRRSKRLFGPHTILWFEPPSILVAELTSQGSTKDLYEISLDPKATERRLDTSLPKFSHVLGASLAHKPNKLVLWLALPDTRSPWLRKLLFFEPSRRPGPLDYVNEQIWVSGRFLENMRLIGATKAAPPSEGLSALHWLPDGNQFLFVLGGRAYSSSAD